MPSIKFNYVGKKAVLYTVFLSFVLIFNIFANFEEKLSEEETAFLQSFQAQAQIIEPIQSASAGDIGTGIRYGAVLEDGLNVRTGPGIDYPIYGMLNRTDEVQLLAEMPGGWWKIALDGYAYYVKSEFIAPRS